MTLECKVEDLEQGWSRFTISNSQSKCAFEYSYLNSPIEELIFLIYEINTDPLKKEYRIVFPEEPGQNVLYIYCVDENAIMVKVTSSPEWEKISKAYDRDSEENTSYLDDKDNKLNFTKKMLDAINDYLRATRAINKPQFEIILRKIEALVSNRA